LPVFGFEQGNTALMNYSGFKFPGNWWEKLIGDITGLMRGDNRTRDAFIRALFSTIAQISKEDGRVTKKEIAATKALIERLKLTESERRQAILFFQKGREQDFDLQGTLQEFAARFKLRYELRITFMEMLLEAAVSDGNLSVGEEAILERVRIVLKIPINVFIAMLSAREAERQPQPDSRNHRQAVNMPQPLSQSYAAFGLKAEASVQEVKRAYRKMISQYHPDKLISQGLPDEIKDMAKRRVYEINTAYNRIKSSRKKTACESPEYR
jgi:DnaJ like chaperone protein